MFKFSALGTDITVSGEGQVAVAREIMRLEGVLTRFRPSPLTTLNRQGELHYPPPELVQAIKYALTVSAHTGGLVTPAVLPALEAAGYACSLGHHRGHAASVPDTSTVVCGAELIRLPSGMRLDLGGTAKSWIAERAFEYLLGDGFIDVGGDVLLRQSGMFAVKIARPDGGSPLYLECPPGTWGVATSSTLKRSWPGGHHLIDPRTAIPLVSDLVQVTAIAPQLTNAEVLTKLAFLDPEKLGPTQQAQVYAFDHEGQFLSWQAGRWQAAEHSSR